MNNYTGGQEGDLSFCFHFQPKISNAFLAKSSMEKGEKGFKKNKWT